jgi:hypothetical protein
MKTITTLGTIFLFIFACRLCSMTGAHDYDPYKGSLKTLLPSQTSVGLINFRLDSSQADDLDGAQEAVKANYTMQAGSISVPVVLQVGNYGSAQEAEARMQAFADKHGLTLESKTKGGTGGKRLTWGDGKAIMWSNGSLQCLATSTFAKTTSNLEEALPF